MEIVVRCCDSEYEVQLDDDRVGTIGDLVGGWFDAATSIVAIDGRRVAPSVPIAEVGLRPGSILEVGDPFGVPQRGLLIAGPGPLDGQTIPLLADGVSIGAAPADVVVATAPGRITLHVDGAGAISIRNPERCDVGRDGVTVSDPIVPVAVGSTLQLGLQTFQVGEGAQEYGSGSGIFNRPPRAMVGHHDPILDLPAPPPEPAKAMRFGWGALVVPLALGLAMALLIHPRMAMFALFSPAMLVANWFEDRRRARRERRETGETFRQSLQRFAATVATAHRREVDIRSQQAISPADLVTRALRGDSQLWERRPDHVDFMQIPVGIGCLPWNPQYRGNACPESDRIRRRYAELHDVPVLLDLRGGDVTGIAGVRSILLAMARQIVLQAAVFHGPADLAISVFTENPADWDWIKWLPHVLVDSSGRRRIAATDEDIEKVVGLLPKPEAPGAVAEADPARRHLLVVDLPDLVHGARGGIREVLRSGKRTGVAGLTLAPQPIDLPSVATTIVVAAKEQTRLRYPQGDQLLIAPWGIGARQARAAARGLARLDDPEAQTSGAGLPGLVHLPSLFQVPDTLEASIRRAWNLADGALRAPIGVGPDGPLYVDLVADGPHALLGGTTGAGKSELLRTLVASLAATASPLMLNFVLFDYKGGSAFDACADLPHTVGLVTDLDDHLARRAMICLEAELRYRECFLRAAGATDIAALDPQVPDRLPRLLLVVDEFAALAKELPDFMDALVDIAQRGRSLGVHLLLATQRPNGVINDNIKANTNLRIALRVQDNADSVDVIGCDGAAAIGRSQAGRGLARLGPQDVVPFQTALVTDRSLCGHATAGRMRPFVFSHEQPTPPAPTAAGDDQPTDLELIVAACRQLAEEMSLPPGRAPWPETLPDQIWLEDLDDGEMQSGRAVFARADEPHRQRQVPVSWSPSTGNLLLYGLPGSGTSTAVATIVIGLAEHTDPDRLHIYVLDLDDQSLLPLRGLAHVGAVVAANERERQIRLLRRLAAELAERRHVVAADPAALADLPQIVVALDNYAGFADMFDESGDMAIRDILTRLVADGPGVGILTIATAKHPGDIPTRLSSLIACKLAFRLADRYDYSGLGIPAVEPPLIPGRAFEARSGREIQVAVASRDGFGAAVAGNRWRTSLVAPWEIDVLPQEVAITDVIAVGHISPDEWFLPLGIGDTALSPVGLVLRDGEHALITGPAQSGKSTALLTVAAAARAAQPELKISAVLPRRSPLSESHLIDAVVDPAEHGVALDDGLHLVLVDDAEMVPEQSTLADILATRHPGVHVVAAGSAEAIRGLYGHWTQEVRRSRIGCALRPNVAADGDLWQTPLPRRGPDRFPTGRGYLLADGRTELVQLGKK